jgi:hypothetical protein
VELKGTYGADTQNSAEDLTTDGEILGKETGHVGSERDRVGASPVVVEDSLQQIPDLPVGLTPCALDGSRGGQTEEVHDHIGHKDGGSLHPAEVRGPLAVSRQIRQVDQHGREGAHDEVDTSHDRPSEA